MPDTAPKHPYVIYQRTPNSPWWVRFSIRGEGQIRKRLGTSKRYERQAPQQTRVAQLNQNDHSPLF